MTIESGTCPVQPSPTIGERLRWQRRAQLHLQARWPAIRRALPRDIAIVLVAFVLTRFFAIAWVQTDSVHTSVALVIRGAAVHPGELAVFAYQGGQLPHYYADDKLQGLRRTLGMPDSTAGPRLGTGVVKYLLGVAGDHIEVQGNSVFVDTRRGRFYVGQCKTRGRLGDPLTPIASGEIPPGYVYMWAPHPDALDSRYAVMGLVRADHIVGRAVRLW